MKLADRLHRQKPPKRQVKEVLLDSRTNLKSKVTREFATIGDLTKNTEDPRGFDLIPHMTT